MSTLLDEFWGKCLDMPWAGGKCPRGHMSVPKWVAVRRVKFCLRVILLEGTALTTILTGASQTS